MGGAEGIYFFMTVAGHSAAFFTRLSYSNDSFPLVVTLRVVLGKAIASPESSEIKCNWTEPLGQILTLSTRL